MSKLIVSFLVALTMVTLVTGGAAQEGQPLIGSDVASLAGLDGVSGLLVDLDSDLVKSGLSKADVRAEIEVLLYKYGVLKREWKPFNPVLHVQVGTFKIGKVQAFTVRLEFLQNMLFDRSMPESSSTLFIPKSMPVATWSETALGTAPISDLSGIRRALQDVTSRFITDFKKANGKQ